MADELNEELSQIRKLRKKLRQIENLNRLYRDLTEEEYLKVKQKEIIREQLQELLERVDEKAMVGAPAVVDVVESTPILETINVDVVRLKGEQSGEEDEVVDVDHQDDDQVHGYDDQVNGHQLNDDEAPCIDIQNSHFEDEKPTETSINISVGLSNENGAISQAAKNGLSSKEKNTKTKNIGSLKEWKDVKFAVHALEGHHHSICTADCIQDVIVSGGHDTSLKIWNSKSKEEVFSLGGHTGSISCALLIADAEGSIKSVVTGSQDCSIRFWDATKGAIMKMLYIYNPVTCIDLKDGILAVGNEGGKIELVDIESCITKFSVKAHEESIVALKFMDGDRLASAGIDGVVKVFEVKHRSLKQIFNSYDDVTGVTTATGNLSQTSKEDNGLSNLPLKKVSCIATFKNLVFWGDDGYNVKALDVTTGQVTKLRNNLNEYSPTDSLNVLSNGDFGWLFSAGFDVDNGNSYINVRTLPNLKYVGTISEESLGHISCISSTLDDNKIVIVTAGSQLKVWKQVLPMKSKKRQGDAIEDYIPSKFVCSYNIDKESEDEEESNESDVEELKEESKPEVKGSWCLIQ